MAITASLVKELRERTGAGMMDCKKALTEAGGDIEAAIEEMRKSGMAKAAKKAGRVAAEGTIIVSSADNKSVILEVNSETDFVAKDENFTSYAKEVAGVVLAEQPTDVEALMAAPMAGNSVEDARQQLIQKIGENINVRRFEVLESAAVVGAYQHGAKIGVLVEMEGGDESLAKDIAMHIAASRPICINEDEVPQDTLEKEKEIFSAQAAESGKPAEIIEKMVTGRIAKYLKEVTLLGQPFVKDPDTNVEKLLKGANATVKRFIRYEVGEGIEKKEDNFAEEVMAQAKGA